MMSKIHYFNRERSLIKTKGAIILKINSILFPPSSPEEKIINIFQLKRYQFPFVITLIKMKKVYFSFVSVKMKNVKIFYILKIKTTSASTL